MQFYAYAYAYKNLMPLKIAKDVKKKSLEIYQMHKNI